MKEWEDKIRDRLFFEAGLCGADVDAVMKIIKDEAREILRLISLGGEKR